MVKSTIKTTSEVHSSLPGLQTDFLFRSMQSYVIEGEGFSEAERKRERKPARARKRALASVSGCERGREKEQEGGEREVVGVHCKRK